MAAVTPSSLVLKLHTDLSTLREYKDDRDVTLAILDGARRKIEQICYHLNAIEREAKMMPPDQLADPRDAPLLPIA